MKLNSILEAGINRRGFLKKVGAVAGAAATSGSLPTIVSKLYDPLSHISDKMLTNMRENQWIDKIPLPRLQRIIKNDPEYAQFELANKFAKVVQYGLGHEQSGKIIKMLADTAKKINVNPFEDEFKETISVVINHSDKFDIDVLEKIADQAGVKIPKNVVNDIKRTTTPQASDRARTNQNRIQKKTETFSIPDDYHLASPMHQPFEHKLTQILSRII